MIDMKELKGKSLVRDGVSIEVIDRMDRHEQVYDHDLIALADPKTDMVLFRLYQARNALAEAKTLSEAKKILDVAAAAEVYINRQQLGEQAEQYAYSVKMEAKIRLGEMLIPAIQHQGGRPVENNGNLEEPFCRLEDLGIKKKLSSEAQRLASLAPETKLAVISGEIRQTEAFRVLRKQGKIREAQELPEGTYRVIYADPPWRYNDARAMPGYNMTAAEENYPTMSIEELCHMDVKRIAGSITRFLQSLRSYQVQGFQHRLLSHYRSYDSNLLSFA